MNTIIGGAACTVHCPIIVIEPLPSGGLSVAVTCRWCHCIIDGVGISTTGNGLSEALHKAVDALVGRHLVRLHEFIPCGRGPCCMEDGHKGECQT
jgi:hypothetical protein